MGSSQHSSMTLTVCYSPYYTHSIPLITHIAYLLRQKYSSTAKAFLQECPCLPSRTAIPKSFLFFGENFLLLVCELFRAHEMRSQLEVTEMLECKVNLTV